MIEIQHITKEFKGHRGLNDVSFSVPKGQVFCLIGANGAGKSTTIKILTNQITPTSGTATIAGVNVSESFNQIKPDIAYVPENLMLYGHLSGIQNLDFFCNISGLTYSEDELKSYLSQVGLDQKFFQKKLENYSKGMKQKVGIAFALAKKAKVLFLDEPTSGLDPKSIAEFSGLIKALKHDGMTILMTSHDLFRTINDADNIGIMREGNLLEIVDAKQITFAGLEKKYMDYMND
jgi:ABC-2 type transport system ATP-binding protein